MLQHPETGLPNAQVATADDRKFTRYLFDGVTKKGLLKGEFITKKLGYDIHNYSEFKREILERAMQYPAEYKREDEHGKRYEQQIFMYDKEGNPVSLEVGWLVNGEKLT